MIVPYTGPIEGSLKPGYNIVVRGATAPTANRFAINLQTGPNILPRDDVAFHFSPDFNRFAVIRNNILQNSWGPEESVGPFPFARGAPFEIVIVCEADVYKVLVNGRELTTFEHRIPFSNVRYIAIDGDITLEMVKCNQTAQPGYGFSMDSTPYPSGPPMGQFAPPYPMVNPSPTSYPPMPPSSGYPSAPGGYPQQPGGAYPPSVGGAYPAPGGPYPVHGGAYPQQGGGYAQPGPYPQHGGAYPQHGGGYPQSGGAYPQGYNGGQPLYPGAPPGAPNLSNQPGHKGGLMDKASMALAGAVGGAGLLGAVGLGKKGLKSPKKANKKLLKYGVPIAGVGLGAYALKKGIGGFWSSSSDSD